MDDDIVVHYANDALVAVVEAPDSKAHVAHVSQVLQVTQLCLFFLCHVGLKGGERKRTEILSTFLCPNTYTLLYKKLKQCLGLGKHFFEPVHGTNFLFPFYQCVQML